MSLVRFAPRRKPRTRKDMTAYLSEHFRYNTMNSWNRSTSYANCVKIHKLGLTAEQMERAWEMCRMDTVQERISIALSNWGSSHGWRWQIGFNGRSGGYLVLYQGGLDREHAKTAECDHCGRLTWHKSTTPCTRSGCAGTLEVLSEPRPQIFTRPGMGLDQDEDYETWSMEALRDRTELILDFDKACDDITDLFAWYCDNYDVEEREFPTTKTCKVLVAREGSEEA